MDGGGCGGLWYVTHSMFPDTVFTVWISVIAHKSDHLSIVSSDHWDSNSKNKKGVWRMARFSWGVFKKKHVQTVYTSSVCVVAEEMKTDRPQVKWR